MSNDYLYDLIMVIIAKAKSGKGYKRELRELRELVGMDKGAKEKFEEILSWLGKV